MMRAIESLATPLADDWLLIAKGQLRTIYDDLLERGYFPEVPLPPGCEDAYVELEHALDFVPPDGRGTLRIQWAAAPTGLGIALPLDVSATHHLVLLAIRGALCLWTHAGLVAAIRDLAGDPGVDWPAARAMAAAAGCARMLDVAVRVACARAPRIPLPDDMEEACSTTAVRFLEARVRSVVSRQVSPRVAADLLADLCVDAKAVKRYLVLKPAPTDLRPGRSLTAARLARLHRLARRTFGQAVSRVLDVIRRGEAIDLARFRSMPDHAVERMLRFADVGPKDVVCDVGCGDGRIVVAAALRGARAIGIESNPRRAALSRLALSTSGVDHLATIREEDARHSDLRDVTVVTMYLQHSPNLMLRPILKDRLRRGARVISYNFDMGNWIPDEVVEFAEAPWGCQVLYRWSV